MVTDPRSSRKNGNTSPPITLSGHSRTLTTWEEPPFFFLFLADMDQAFRL
ncbi:MAG: hypothetical protein U0176_01250 [Bacteroidia bacterium]